MLPKGALIKKQRSHAEKEVIGHAHSNPLLDTRVYEAAFNDGTICEYSTNVISENIYTTVNDEGFETYIFKDNYHRVDLNIALSDDNAWTISHNGN